MWISLWPATSFHWLCSKLDKSTPKQLTYCAVHKFLITRCWRHVQTKHSSQQQRRFRVENRCDAIRNTLTALPKVLSCFLYYITTDDNLHTADCEPDPKASHVPCCGLIGKQKRGESFRLAGFENMNRWRQVNGERWSMWRLRASGIQRSRRTVSAVLWPCVIKATVTKWTKGETGLLDTVISLSNIYEALWLVKAGGAGYWLRKIAHSVIKTQLSKELTACRKSLTVI